MRILLLGEYSNVHWTLAEGLRALGHDVTVVSDGDRWKNYRRDIDLRRGPISSKLSTLNYLWDIARLWPRLRDYDIVQLINPVFLDLRAERLWPFYQYLRRHNRRIVLGAFGIDHYWVRVGMDCHTFRYSDFNIGPQLRSYPFMDEMVRDWLHSGKGELNQRIAADADAIVTGLYEYECCYRPFYDDKTRFIPFPINVAEAEPTATLKAPPPAPPQGEGSVKGGTSPTQHLPLGGGREGASFFIGIQRARSSYKGTDIMLAALEQLQADFGPERVVINKAESVPFEQYVQMMNSSHVLLDQLYSYTPAMNALQAMAKGLIVVGGGEEEHYQLLGETELRPIINVYPTAEDVYTQIRERLLEHPEDIHQLQLDSIEYVRRHHDHIAVARRYAELYEDICR